MYELGMVYVMHIYREDFAQQYGKCGARPNYTPILYCVYALVGRAISIRFPYICVVHECVSTNPYAVFHRPVVCAVKTKL